METTKSKRPGGQGHSRITGSEELTEVAAAGFLESTESQRGPK